MIQGELAFDHRGVTTWGISAEKRISEELFLCQALSGVLGSRQNGCRKDCKISAATQ